MLPDKSILLEQITTAIQNNSCKTEQGRKTFTSEKNHTETTAGLSNAHFFTYSRDLELLKRLEQRIEALEDQNDRLLYFIHFLYKNFPELVRDILPAEQEEVHVPHLKGRNDHLPGCKNNSPSLTPREIEILQLLVKGLCAKQIACQLFISETTVITHKKNLKEKFNAKNTVELISKAFNWRDGF